MKIKRESSSQGGAACRASPRRHPASSPTFSDLVATLLERVFLVTREAKANILTCVISPDNQQLAPRACAGPGIVLSALGGLIPVISNHPLMILFTGDPGTERFVPAQRHPASEWQRQGRKQRWEPCASCHSLMRQGVGSRPVGGRCQLHHPPPLVTTSWPCFIAEETEAPSGRVAWLRAHNAGVAELGSTSAAWLQGLATPSLQM